MTDHTPGPWRSSIPFGNSARGIYASDPYKVIATTSSNAVGDEDEQVANARLIAAAPDMYDALRDAVSWLETLEDNGHIDALIDAQPERVGLNYLRRTIAKAEGGTQ